MRKYFVVTIILCTFANEIKRKDSDMGKLMLLLYFILSVFPADATENRRHIHVVRRGSKKSHRGNTVAKIWIEENGRRRLISPGQNSLPTRRQKSSVPLMIIGRN